MYYISNIYQSILTHELGVGQGISGSKRNRTCEIHVALVPLLTHLFMDEAIEAIQKSASSWLHPHLVLLMLLQYASVWHGEKRCSLSLSCS